MKNDVLLIIPAFNEAENIENVINTISKFGYDYVIVNDGSSDKTLDICRKNHYKLLDLDINLGLAGAFQTGIKYAYYNNYKYAIQFDADGQHLPDFIENMKEKCNDCDIVIGSRFVTERKGKSMRMLGSNMISLAIKLTTLKKINDPTSGMRMYNRKMIEIFAKNINYAPEPDTIAFLLRSGIKIKEVQVKMNERVAGESYLNSFTSIKYMIRMIISIFLIQFARKKMK